MTGILGSIGGVSLTFATWNVCGASEQKLAQCMSHSSIVFMCSQEVLNVDKGDFF